jgi:hypothetical protein
MTMTMTDVGEISRLFSWEYSEINVPFATSFDGLENSLHTPQNVRKQ